MDTTSTRAGGIHAARLDPSDYARNFADSHPPLTRAQALVEAERCLYCYDAPCVAACPTGIDVPSFIRRIADDNLRGAASAILEANPLGGICARVCPTEVLCEQVCVRNTNEGKPVEIGRLQRYAVDAVMDQPGAPLFARAARDRPAQSPSSAPDRPVWLAPSAWRATAMRSCCYDARPKGGGLNEYGLATYKTTGGFAQQRARLAAVDRRHHAACRPAARHATQLDGAARRITTRSTSASAWPASMRSALPGADLAGVRDAVDFIAELRQADRLLASCRSAAAWW